MTISPERPITPDWADVLHAWLEQERHDLHTAMPGRIHAVDWTHGTVDVEPVVRHAVPQSDGSMAYEDLPILPSVPLVMPRSGNWFVSIPVSIGDTVLVVFCESAIGQWRIGDGSPQYPGDLARNSLSHAVAIPGLVIRNAALATPQTGGGHLDTDLVLGKAGGTQIALKSDGSITVTQGATVVAQIDPDGTNHAGGSGGKFVGLNGDTVNSATSMASWISAITSAVNTATGGSIALPTDFGTLVSSATKAKGV